MQVIKMNPGDLKQRLTFQIPAGGRDDDGYPITNPIVYTKAWGSLKTLKGNTRFIAAQSQMQHHREFVIRYQRKLEDDERPKSLELVWKGKRHEIESIENDDGLNETMTVFCKALS